MFNPYYVPNSNKFWLLINAKVNFKNSYLKKLTKSEKHLMKKINLLLDSAALDLKTTTLLLKLKRSLTHQLIDHQINNFID